NNLGLVLMWQGRLAEAVNTYRQALALKPDYCEAYTNLAAALVTAEEFSASLAALRCALMVDETNGDARSLAVHCINQLRSAEEASPFRDLVVGAVSRGWGRSIELARISASLIKRNPSIGACIERAAKGRPRGRHKDGLL